MRADMAEVIVERPRKKGCAWNKRCTAVDVLLNVPVARLTALEARRHCGAEVYAVASRRLARKELRQYPIPVLWWG